MNFFEGYGTQKSVRYFICKTGSLQLWTSLNLVHAHIEGWDRDGAKYRELEMKTLRNFPYDTDETCRCRDCRYIRITRNWSNL